MDVLAAAGRLTLAVTLDGVAAPAGTVELGARGAPGGATLDLADPVLLGEPRGGAGTAPPREITVALWRAAGTTAAAPALDDATRERLRQLGYVE